MGDTHLIRKTGGVGMKQARKRGGQPGNKNAVNLDSTTFPPMPDNSPVVAWPGQI